MKKEMTPGEKKANRVLIAARILTVIMIASIFFPAINPARMLTKIGSTTNIKNTASLFTCSISYNSLISGYEKAFKPNIKDGSTLLDKSLFTTLYISCLVMLLGIIAIGAAMCVSIGNIRCKKLSTKIGMAGCAVLGGGSALLLVFHEMLVKSIKDFSKINTRFPNEVFIYIGFAGVLFLVCLIAAIMLKKEQSEGKFEMETQYKLFLMFLPFIMLIFAFSYLPLVSWRYAFYDVKVGEALTKENYVGFKFFTTLFANKAYRSMMLKVMRNTLAMSGIGIAMSWLPMVFAIFLNECKSARFKRTVQVFTTIPNFISWVLIYSLATAIFSTDGFLNSLLTLITGKTWATNYLLSNKHMWIKMWAWGTWKGVGWSAIIYISGIAGIDQQLYEAASIDGAGRFARMRHVTLPGILPTFVVMLVMSIAGILSNGMDQYLVFKHAQNIEYLNVLDLYTYTLGLGDGGNLPLATVVGMAKSVISVILLFIANSASKMIRGNSVV